MADERLESPDGRIVVTFMVDQGRPMWRLYLDNQPLTAPGVLGLELARDSFKEPFALERMEKSSASTTWNAVWGNLSKVQDHYNQLLFTIREDRPQGRSFQVILRAYDQGVGIRYVLPAQAGLDHPVIRRRLTEYAFPSNRTVYQNRNYEYGDRAIDTMSRSEGAVAIDAGDGRFVGLTDSDRADFPIVSWERSKHRLHTVVGTLNSAAEGALPFHTSWEVVIVAPSVARLYENRFIVENLAPPCAIPDTTWIRAGSAICQVRNTRMVSGELMKLAEFASRHNIPNLEIDHSWCGAETKWTDAEIDFFDRNKSNFWADKPEWRSNVGGNPMAPARGWVPFRPKADSGGNFVDLDVAQLCDYARKLNPPVGICVYLRGAVVREFGGEHGARDIFSVYKRWGLAGIKLGFVPSGSQKNERAIAQVVRIAAEHQLIVNIHDSYYPAGLSRTYPNLVNVEGVAGEEAEHSIPPQIKSLHDIMLPFTRCLMGPVDYTPEIYKPIKTHAHQVAMLGVYHGRPSIRGGMKQWSPGGAGGQEIEFVEKLPALFDEMRVFTELGKYVCVARRAGDRWFIASMNDGSNRSFDLPLDFLKPGVTYSASIYADTPGSLRTTHTSRQLDNTTKLSIQMEPNGGQVMILTP